MRSESMSAKIGSSDISVVVQGPVISAPELAPAAGLTARCLESIRRHLPDAEIVLSTWSGSDTLGMMYDLLVENDDPGSQICHSRVSLYNNVNRQIVSSLAGIKRATRPYTVKVRSDILFTGSGFLEYFGKYPCRCDQMRFLRERVLNCTLYAKNPRRHFPFPFHPSDWFFFGLREDLLAIWDIPLAQEPEMSRWFETHPRPVPDLFPHLLLRNLPEQYIWIAFLHKFEDINLAFPWERSPQTVDLSERSFANNLVFLEPHRIGIRSLKHPLTLDNWASVYSLAEWERLYRRYCDPHYQAHSYGTLMAKDVYQFCQPLSPKRMADRFLARLLRADPRFLGTWERRCPRSFRLASAMFKKLG